MPEITPRTRRTAVAVGTATLLVAGLATALAAAPATADEGGLAGSDLYLNPWSTTLEAAQQLSGQARVDAQLLGSIPSADWFTSGTPDEVRAAVDAVVTAADAAGKMPVLVAYNLPFRDCAQYSAGGAFDTAEYKAWIDGFAAGIDGRAATVILEPDGLGIIPHYTNLDGGTEWCQPAELDPATAAADRFEQMNYAVDALGAAGHTSVYLDATHSGWLNVGDATDRLLKGGVERATGFFLNASNYNFTANLEAYGRWISSCIAYVTEVAPGGYGNCGNQYWNGGPATNWSGVAMSNFGEWSADSADPALNTSGVDSRYESILGGVEPTTTFVIDTSRNGAGPWQAPGGVYTDAEDWCNPPDRGLGALPTTDTGVALVDAYLWIKVPGESDGKCFRGTGGPLDPERGIENPAAGQWFTEQARELIVLASPTVEPLSCHVAWESRGAGKGFAVTVRITGAGTEALTFSVPAGQDVTKVVGGTFTRTGDVVTVTAARKGSAPLVIHGKGAGIDPWQFHVAGQACTS
jgi:endoglucanase